MGSHMATETTVPMDDTDLMSDAMAPVQPRQDAPAEAVPAAEAPKSEPKEDKTGRLHGEGGKFVPKAKDADAAPIQQQAQEQPNPLQQAPPPPPHDHKA